MPAVIVGGGRVGQALAEMGVEGDVIVRRGESFPSEPKTGPIFVATRNDVLEDVIKNTPPERREDLVFMQNGMLQTFLDAQGLGSNTQALIHFAVAAAGDKPTDGVTELNPEGLTAVTGKWADAVAARFHNGDLSCHVLDASTYEGSMYEKLIWICAMMLVGAQHEGAKVGDVATTYKDEVVGLIEELLSGTSACTGAKFAPGAVDRLIAYAENDWRISRAASKSSLGEMVTFTDYRRKPSQTGRLIRFRLTPRSLKTSAPFNRQPCTHTFFVCRPASSVPALSDALDPSKRGRASVRRD